MCGCAAATALAMHCVGARQHRRREVIGAKRQASAAFVPSVRDDALLGFQGHQCIGAWRGLRVHGFRFRHCPSLARTGAWGSLQWFLDHPFHWRVATRFSFLGRRSFSRRPLKPRSRGLGQASRLLPPPGRSSRLCP
ncbi:conserved hypothetical protein [Xanthomonas citri pv. fuscans]|nr:conserved hypothetical protein [Xanthomonas citri pv. fuscans]